MTVSNSVRDTQSKVNMRRERSANPTLVAFVVVYWLAAGCKAPPPSPGCVPGKSEACVGPNACTGFQECAADGHSFGSCTCPAPTSALSGGRNEVARPSESASPPKPSEPAGSTQENEDFFTYGNGRFGFRLDVPKAFNPHTPPTNGDGQGWSGEGGVELSAAGMLDGDGFWSGFAEKKSKLPADAYIKKDQNWYVLSWKDAKSDLITYERCNLRKDSAASACFTLTFPVPKKAELDAIITRMSRTFRFEGGSLQ